MQSSPRRRVISAGKGTDLWWFPGHEPVGTYTIDAGWYFYMRRDFLEFFIDTAHLFV